MSPKWVRAVTRLRMTPPPLLTNSKLTGSKQFVRHEEALIQPKLGKSVLLLRTIKCLTHVWGQGKDLVCFRAAAARFLWFCRAARASRKARSVNLTKGHLLWTSRFNWAALQQPPLAAWMRSLMRSPTGLFWDTTIWWHPASWAVTCRLWPPRFH